MRLQLNLFNQISSKCLFAISIVDDKIKSTPNRAEKGILCFLGSAEEQQNTVIVLQSNHPVKKQ